MTVRLLVPGDEVALEGFLAPLAETSMFLRSNARAGGLVDRGEPAQATYVAAFDGERIVAVAAHCWNGMVLVQAPAGHLAATAGAAVARSGRAVAGIAGPWEQVLAAERALGLEARPRAKSAPEALMTLELAALRVPEPLAAGRLACRHPRPDELDFLTAWRADFLREALGYGGPDVGEKAAGEVRDANRRGTDWLLLEGERPVACSMFNAVLPDIVQIGGVWTPPPLRGRGYGRAVVAGSLLAARAAGVRRSVLFAERPDAIRAYEGLGFRAVGSYGLLLLSDT